MKREVWFRGKRIDNGEWVYGYYVFQPENKNHYDIHWILTGNDDVRYGSGTAWETFDKFQVDPKTVGEFTGLKDKNEKDIYEGDILKLQYPLNYGFAGIHIKEITVTISFESGCFGFTGDGYTDCNWHFYNEYEVIGNIYENPELLK